MTGIAPDDVHLVVIAKEPRPGFAKTRLSPPCSLAAAAAIAEAALADTLAAVATTPASRRTMVVDGRPGPWLPEGFAVLDQVSGGLGARLYAAFDSTLAAGAPVVLIGMDTPQVTPRHLHDAAERLGRHDAVLGPATDGGYWLIGLSHLHPRAFDGVPMSTSTTCAAQRDQLEACGYDVAVVDELRDVDSMDDALAVATTAPNGAFARAVAAASATDD